MPRSRQLARSYLYVPGHRLDLIEKAKSTEADAIVIDLEDAVAPENKHLARENLEKTVAAPTAKAQQLWVRVNAPGQQQRADLAAAAGPFLTGVRIPKVESADDVRAVARVLGSLAPHAQIQCTIESALGVEQIEAIARADERITAIGLGEADLSADLGLDGDDGLGYARSRCVVAARAAGLSPPVQSVFTALADSDGLRRSTESGRRLGFFGRSAIHPTQIAVINEIHTPSPQRVQEARELISQLEHARAEGSSAFVQADGRFVDPAVVESARRIVELAARLQEATP